MNNKLLHDWWALSKDEVLNKLEVNAVQGLSEENIQRNRKTFGTNELEEIKPEAFWQLILESIKEPMMLLLLGIALLSFVFGKILEATFMIFVVVAYVSVEFLNKFRTDRIMSKLRELTQPETRVIRNSQPQLIKTSEIVVGDIVILSEGVKVPVDLRLIESLGLLVNEASLTGESYPVQKDAQAQLQTDTPLAERRNGVFSGTAILSGEGLGVVVAVGKESELGAISKEVLRQRKEKTFIQASMTRLAKTLAVLAIIVSIIIPLIGFLRGLSGQEMILTWLALTFLMVPGQPPIIITMALALASFDLARKKLIVKRLKGVEVLGQISAIATDKTGTITENKMKVVSLILTSNKLITFEELTDELKAKINLCLPEHSTDPTDIAVQDLLKGIKREGHYSHLYSFSENHPWRILTYEESDPSFSSVAGQPERLIKFSQLSSKEKEILLTTMHRETDKGNRVIGFAFKNDLKDDLASGLELLALVVLSDPVRRGVKVSIDRLKKAGITTYMFTGDHPSTAARIAHQIGLNGNVLVGGDIEKMGDQELRERLQSIKAFARISPAQKQRVVTILKQNGEVIAVIGDGVNDAPAIKAADIGIAMGEIGTDLAKEAADLILTDDNYTHLPDAVEIGRKAIDNFRKGLTYYLSAKAILLFTFLVPLGLGIPFPFSPIHIIFIELLMDLASSTIFVTERAEPDIMERAPQKVDFLNLEMGWKIFQNGAPLALGITAIYLGIYYATSNVVLAQTAAFVAWLLGHILLALNLKQDRLPLLKQGIRSNHFGFFWLIGMIGMSLSITMIPPLYPFFHTTALTIPIWIVILIVIFSTTFWIEIKKRLKVDLKRLTPP